MIQAVPSVGAAIATGGTAGLILSAAESAGGTYTDLLQHHIIAGDSIEEAHKKAAGTAIASGAVSLALSKIMPGGAQALNNPATREAAQKAFSATVKSAIKGGAEEISQEAIDGGFNHILTEMHKGKTFEQAATSYAEQFPQSALTSALLGGGVQAMADKNNGNAQTPQQPATAPQQSTPTQPATTPQFTQPKPPASAQQPAPSNPQQQIPLTTTPSNPASPSVQPPPSASAQQPQTSVNNGQPPPTSPSLPPPTTAPKSPEQSQQLINNIMNRPPEQRGHPQVQSDVAQARDVLHDHVQKLENQPEPLSEAQKKELTDAKTTLSRLPAEKPASTPESTRRPESANHPQAEAPEGTPRPHGEVDADAPNAAVDPNRAPHTDPDAEAPHSRGDSDQRTHPAETQPDGSRPTRTLPGDAALPHRYDSTPTPPSSRNSPDGRSLEPSYPSPARNSSPAINATDTTPYHPSTPTDSQPAANPQPAGRTANGNTPDQPQNAAANPGARSTTNSRPPSPNTPGILPAPTASGSPSSSPSRTSPPPPRTPPLSPEQSQRLLDNVAKMPEKAQQHPQVQADVAQARSVVAGAGARSPWNSPRTQSGSSVATTSAGNPSAANTHPPGPKGSVPDEPRLSNATPSHAPALAKSMSGEGSQIGGKTVDQSHTPHQGQPPVAPKVPLSSSVPKLTPKQQANIPKITQTAKTLLNNLTGIHTPNFKDLKTPIVESADANTLTQSGMWLNADYSIGYHLPTLAAELATHADHAIPGRIDISFNNLLQASPAYDLPASTSQANKSISQSGTQPGVDAPNTYTTVEKNGIAPHLKEWARIDGEIQQMENDLLRVISRNDTFAKDRIQTKLFDLESEKQNLIDQAHQFIAVPTGMRIPFPFTALTPSSRTAAIRGAALAERYIHPDLLPSMGTVDYNDSRAGQFRGMLLINRSSSPSKVLHEIAHGVEEQSQRVRDKCLAFLQKRAGNEKPQKLALLTGDKNYTNDEVAYEDEFGSRGGSHYMGKRYPDGTEILTMGIERLHADPIEFYINDPEYFQFVIQTLQHP